MAAVASEVLQSAAFGLAFALALAAVAVVLKAESAAGKSLEGDGEP